MKAPKGGSNMSRENEAYNYVLSQVTTEVDELYRYYQCKDRTLKNEEDTMKELEILIAKKYINATYISDLMLIVDYYARRDYANYFYNLQNYMLKIRVFLEDYSG